MKLNWAIFMGDLPMQWPPIIESILVVVLSSLIWPTIVSFKGIVQSFNRIGDFIPSFLLSFVFSFFLPCPLYLYPSLVRISFGYLSAKPSSAECMLLLPSLLMISLKGDACLQLKWILWVWFCYNDPNQAGPVLVTLYWWPVTEIKWFNTSS